jgi:hypothetical protein
MVMTSVSWILLALSLSWSVAVRARRAMHLVHLVYFSLLFLGVAVFRAHLVVENHLEVTPSPYGPEHRGYDVTADYGINFLLHRLTQRLAEDITCYIAFGVTWLVLYASQAWPLKNTSSRHELILGLVAVVMAIVMYLDVVIINDLFFMAPSGQLFKMQTLYEIRAERAYESLVWAFFFCVNVIVLGVVWLASLIQQHLQQRPPSSNLQD